MGYKLIITDDAHRDIDQALDYISHALGNPSAAGQLLIRIEACYRQIADRPRIYPLCSPARLQSLGYRKAVIGHYILIYRLDDTRKIAYILRLFYGGRNYEELI